MLGSPAVGDFLPATAGEVRALGWSSVDVVIVTGDAYVDHPSFGTAVVGRFLASLGLRVAILPQPDWRTKEPFETFGRPNLFFGVTGGNLDSRLASRTAQRKVRNEDAYSPAGEVGLRPDLPTIVYTTRVRQAYPGVPVILGGVEASLRRLAHYDFWSDKVRGPLLLDAKADLLVYGMAEGPLEEIVTRLKQGEELGSLRTVQSTVFPLGEKEVPSGVPRDAVELPSLDAVKADPKAFAAMTRLLYENLRPPTARPLVQFAGKRAIVVNPPMAAPGTRFFDRVMEAPFTRRAHPSHKEPIPALAPVQDSVIVTRGCFGGCRFCGLSLHQGLEVVSRSRASVLREVQALATRPGFGGTITDLGGPTANAFGLGCANPRAKARCRKPSCLFPRICPNLETDHESYVRLLGQVRQVPGVRHVFVSSGIRMDLALRSPKFIDTLARHHVGGLLSVAPEHTNGDVLRAMGKHSFRAYEDFLRAFRKASDRAGKKQHLSLYLMVGHPGTSLEAARSMAGALRRLGLKPRQVQEFAPLPLTWSGCMYYTGLDPASGKAVAVSRKLSDKRLEKELAFWWQVGGKPRKKKGIR